jgi:putative heme-binding domain-containing protein
VSALEKLFDHPAVSVRAAAVRLAGGWRLAAATPRVRQLAADRGAPPAVRSAAIDALRDLGPDAVAALRTLATDPAEQTAVRRHAVVSLLATAPAEAVAPVRQLLADAAAEPDAAALWRAVLTAGNFGNRLAVEVREQPLPAPAATVGLRVAREAVGRHEDLVRILTRQSGDTAPRNYTGGDVERMAALAKLSGDPARGEMIYRRPELKCVSCHAIGGAGGKVGPDLASVGAAAPTDYLVESIYLPDKAIKEGFHSVQVETLDGKVSTGIIAREGAQELILRDADGKEVAIPRTAIRERTPGRSLMPTGIIDHLFDHEQRDLFRFLSELGRPGPFDAARNQAAKAWRITAVGAGDGAAAARAQLGDDTLPGWTSLTTTVAGALLSAEVRAVPGLTDPGKVVYAATRFEVLKAGRVTLTFGNNAPPAVWVNGKPGAAGTDLPFDLPAGVHTVAVRLDLAAAPKRLTLRSPDVVFRPD